MNKLMICVLMLILTMTVSCISEGLLPDYTETFGVDMPSLSAVLKRLADAEEEADGARSVRYENVTKEEFDLFSNYMEAYGCYLIEYKVADKVMTAQIGKENKSFVFVYDNNDQSCSIIYPAGTNEEDPLEAMKWNAAAMIDLSGLSDGIEPLSLQNGVEFGMNEEQLIQAIGQESWMTESLNPWHVLLYENQFYPNRYQNLVTMYLTIDDQLKPSYTTWLRASSSGSSLSGYTVSCRN